MMPMTFMVLGCQFSVVSSRFSVDPSQAAEDAGGNGLGTWWLDGRLGGDERLDPNSGLRYPVFTVQELESR